MEEAGLTVGGFNARFSDQEHLFQKTLRHLAATGGILQAKHAKTSFSPETPERGWPLPPLAAEVAERGSDSRKAFAEGIQRLASSYAELLPQTKESPQTEELPQAEESPRNERPQAEPGEERSAPMGLALAAWSMGGLTLAPAVEDDDLAGCILAACKLLHEQPSAAVDQRPPADTLQETSARKGCCRFSTSLVHDCLKETGNA